MIGVLGQFRKFQCRTAWFVSSVYFLFALWVAYQAFFVRPDGGMWYFMDFMYWPVSQGVLWIGCLLKKAIPLDVLHEFPTPRFSLIYIYDSLTFIVVGTLWYYWLTKSIVFGLSRLKHRLFAEEAITAG
jgi:hypothetical protein